MVARVSSVMMYRVCLPRALLTAASLFGMLLMRFRQNSTGILYHSAAMRLHSSSQLVGLIEYFPSWIFKYFHMCSIGLRSGDCAGATVGTPTRVT
ncbi:hypothetical protein BKA57DRAFT_254096 [Linnemannia elongata]|nr:hypothetical protein BKA57DRAFT_254096 [Linnemannia elongata]